MRKISLILAAASLSLIQSPAVHAQGMPGGMDGGMGGGMGDMGGGPGGDGDGPGSSKPSAPRPPKPVKRKQFDKIVTAMFREADANKDGMVTIDELHAVVDARREATIRARFEAVDSNRDGNISPAEFMAWQKRMGSAASSEANAFGDRNGPIADAITATSDNPDDYVLIQMIEPLNGTTIARANTNYDAGVSLEELLAYEGKHFDDADKNHDGELSMEELRPAGGPGKGPGRGGPGGAGGPPPCRPGQNC
ncbi:EF-hand domain-containing protein [Novosphingobium sp. P6W]|jgi:Ca2+-binding EF-hand superfamily protein|uniref:EF-hand domain-containing protein n=1 Tax=Novosphingobium sp. P6W TaxID=1609758 RepID=UPI0005C2D934|nr:EF-hand domain-containing protein [Novosphingobium sp. P6W]AXB76337.1 calcium-binding protein [Novosphingobium sp. P6W]KIS32159.1 calcium-binding protein [Novosphingobium sp. P6W]